MARDPFKSLLKVRRLLVERARSDLSACSQAEATATNQLALLNDAVHRIDSDEAAFLGDHQFREMTLIARARLRARRMSASDNLNDLKGRAAEARLALAAVRTSAEVVHRLVQDQATARGLEAARREQHALDDLARGVLVARGRAGKILDSG